MLTVSLFTLVGLIAVAAILLRNGPDEARRADERARIWYRLALIVMGAYGLFLIYMGVGEMAGGDISGFIHLAPAALLGAFMYLSTRRPRETGIALLGVGVATALFVAAAVNNGVELWMQTAAITSLPWLLSALLLLAPEIGRQRGPHDEAQMGV